MIQKMKKLTFLVTPRESEQFLEDLRQAGVVHVQQLKQDIASDTLQNGMALIARYKSAIQRMEIVATSVNPVGAAPAPLQVQTSLELLDAIEALENEKNVLLHKEEEEAAVVAKLEPWGEFSLEALQAVAKEGNMQVNFFCCGRKNFHKDWADQYFAIPVEEADKKVYFVTFSSEVPDIAAERIDIPQESLSYHVQQQAAHHARIGEIDQQLLVVAKQQVNLLKQGLCQVQNDVNMYEVKNGGEDIADGAVRMMLGWTTEENLPQLEQMLQSSGIYYDVEDPAFDDDVPIKIKNSSFSRLFEPILKMYSLPNYRDIDPTEYMAPFFLLFFGLCMGDAGYGLLIMLIGLFIVLKGGKDILDYGKLALWLGGSTLVCGFLTATFFGIDLSTVDVEFLKPMQPYFLNDNGVGPIFGYSPMMVIAVIIGLIQVLLGMILKGTKAWINYGFPFAIGTYSWVVFLLSAIALYGLPACGVALSVAVQYVLLGVIALSGIGIFLYNNPAAYKEHPILGPFLNIGAGVWATYGMATGLLGDLLSYIRLFALGLTGGVLGGVFNNLATDIFGDMSIVGKILGMSIVILFGHGITFALSAISAFVHPMRLTFVEFFKNADFSGGGKAYEPFRKVEN